jgi:hypothetical protein
MPQPETSKHPKAWRTSYASASTNRLSSSFGRIGPSASKTLFILPKAWRRPSAATRRPTDGATCGATCGPCGATCGPCGATCGPCDLACGAAHSPCGPPHSATHSPCDPAGWAACSSSARACGFSHFLTAAGHVDLPSLRFRTGVYSTVAHRYPALTTIGVWTPRQRPSGSDAGRARAYVAAARSSTAGTSIPRPGGRLLMPSRLHQRSAGASREAASHRRHVSALCRAKRNGRGDRFSSRPVRS